MLGAIRITDRLVLVGLTGLLPHLADLVVLGAFEAVMVLAGNIVIICSR